MSKTAVVDRGAGQAPAHPFKRWLFAGLEVKGTQGPHTEEKEIEHPWCDVFNRCELFLHARLSAGPGRACDHPLSWSDTPLASFPDIQALVLKEFSASLGRSVTQQLRCRHRQCAEHDGISPGIL